MIARCSPQETYRRIDFDARVAGADPGQLVLLCYDQFDAALGRALHGVRTGDNRAKSEGLTRAIAALSALQLGIDGSAPMAAPLNQLYRAARATLLDNALAFNEGAVKRVRRDFAEIAAVLFAPQTAP